MGKQCLACKGGFILNRNNICVAQLYCPSGFYNIGQVCKAINANCVIFDYDSKTCSKCATGFTAKSDSCSSDAVSNPCSNARSWYNSTSGRCI